MIRRSKSIALVFLALAAGIYLAGCGAPPEDTPQPSAVTMKRVEVTAVEAARESRELRFSGTTRAARRAQLAFSSSGRLVARPAEIGDRVSRGQLLAQLTDRELRNALVTTRATLAELSVRRAQSERDHARAERLAAAKAATSEELERTSAAKGALEAAEAAAGARLQEAQRRIDETRLVAPFAGTVTDVYFEPGEYTRAGTPVVSLSGDGEIEIEVEVPESVIPRIAAGDEVELRLPVLGDAPVTGRIESVGRTAAGPGRLFPVVATVAEAESLVAGATAELVLRLESDDALSLPVEAVVNPGGRRPAVFRVAGDGGERRVEKVTVEVGSLLSESGAAPEGGRQYGALVIVRGELAAGDLVVTGGQRGLLDGETVEVEQ